MTRQRETMPWQPAGDADAAGYRLALTVPVNNAAADGKASDLAVAKLTLGGNLVGSQPITFTITEGAAVFSNGKKQIDADTNPMGRASVTFTDTTAESGAMTAQMKNDPDVKSAPVSYTFIGGTKPNFAIAFSSLTPGGETADGTSENEGQVVVTVNGGQLTQAQIVKFEFDGGTASFDTMRPGVDQSLSNHSTLYVWTYNENGQDVADAYFNDVEAESVTVMASLKDHSDVPSQTQDFTFTARGSD